MEKDFKQQLMGYMAGNFTCKEVAQLITEYLEGTFSLSQRLRFQMHIGLCFACRTYLHQMKYTVATLRQLPTEPVPPEIKEALMHKFRTWKKDHASEASPTDSQKPS